MERKWSPKGANWRENGVPSEPKWNKKSMKNGRHRRCCSRLCCGVGRRRRRFFGESCGDSSCRELRNFSASRSVRQTGFPMFSLFWGVDFVYISNKKCMLLANPDS